MYIKTKTKKNQQKKLTLYHIMKSFDPLKKKPFQINERKKKEKMLVTNNVFYHMKNILNPLPDNKILDWSKLKQITDDILQCI